MLGDLFSYFERRRNARLFQQWIKEGELPPGELPPDLFSEEPAKETSLAAEGTLREQVAEHTGTIDIDRGMVRLPIRYFLILISVFALLLVTLSVVITILLLRS